MERITGHYIKIGDAKHFIPALLPPHDPAFELNKEISYLYGKAMLKVGQLNEMSKKIPAMHRFLKAYVIKEALLTSAIEGIHTTLIDVLTQPLTGEKPSKETQLVINYTHALDTALEMMHKRYLPISSRVLLATHAALMEGEGDRARPGNYRKLSVRVGDLVPPPANEIPELMTNLEQFINDSDSTIPPLIKAGIAHVQFETIHPFLDGNGRIGRLLIVLMLIESNLLEKPILYPSYYFKKYQMSYYEHLDIVRTHGDFEKWITFYLKGIIASCNDAYLRSQDIEKLELELQQKIAQFSSGREEIERQALTILFEYPLITISDLAKLIGKSYNTTASIIDDFVSLNILEETTEQKRNKVYSFNSYINILEKEYSEIAIE